MGTSKNAYAPLPRDLKITPEGYPFIAVSFLLNLIIYLWGSFLLFLASLFFTTLVVFFFRNPKRDAPYDSNSILAPADGKIVAIENMEGDSLTGGEAVKISTFMSIFNCHVNRAPSSGEVKKIIYNRGKFRPASFKGASQNERNTVLFSDDKGRSFAVIQIAGIIARRIVCYLKEGMSLNKGSRLGLIRFGSRVELVLPANTFELTVKVGDSVLAGKTIIGRWL